MKITLELCQSNSVGNRFSSARVVEIWTVSSREEADKAIEQQRPSGYFVREQSDAWQAGYLVGLADGNPGTRNTAAKSEAARANGAKGGRPRKEK